MTRPYRIPSPPPIYIAPPPLRRRWPFTALFGFTAPTTPRKMEARALVSIAFAVLGIFAGSVCIGYHQPRPCVDSYTILTLGQKVSCPSGARLTIEEVAHTHRIAARCSCEIHP